MERRSRIVGWIGALVAAVVFAASAQPEPAPVRVLVVDETKTFDLTMRVAGLVGALRTTGAFEVGVKLADVATSFDDPLAGRTPEEGEAPYDLIVVLPRGLDDGSIRQIWIVSDGMNALSPIVAASLPGLSDVIDRVFAGIGAAIDVSEDLWPCWLWAAYAMTGWVR